MSECITCCQLALNSKLKDQYFILTLRCFKIRLRGRGVRKINNKKGYSVRFSLFILFHNTIKGNVLKLTVCRRSFICSCDGPNRELNKCEHKTAEYTLVKLRKERQRLRVNWQRKCFRAISLSLRVGNLHVDKFTYQKQLRAVINGHEILN